VVVPTLGKRLDTLNRALASIQEQPGVVVDTLVVARTASTDLYNIADRYHARILVHPGNISSAINAGLAQATDAHGYATWLGDDDMLCSHSLAHTSSLLESKPAAVVAYGSCNYIDLSGALLFCRRPPIMAPTLLHFVPGLIKQEACLFRLSALKQAGGLDEKLEYTMDLDLLLRLRTLGSFVKTHRVTAAFCWHPGSLTIANRKASLHEAQCVQRRHARGLFLWLTYSLLKYPVRGLILALDWKINQGIKSARQ
jgi:GT2 family glycosyltransferase